MRRVGGRGSVGRIALAALCCIGPGAAGHTQSLPAGQTIRVSATGAGTASDRIAAALASARAVRAATGKGATIVLAPGVYHLARPLQIGPADSGTASAPLRIVGEAGGAVVLTGSAAPTEIALPPQLAALIPAAARKRVHAFALPPALAQAFAGEVPRNFNAADTGATVWPIQGSRPLQSARWPDEDYARLPAVPPGGSPASAGVLAIDRDQARQWAREPALRAEGYFTADFAFEWARVQSVDAGNGIVRLTPLTTSYRQASLRRFRIANAFSELDRPGEFAVDPQSGTLVVWPTAAGPLELAVLGTTVAIAGAHDVTIDGIAVEGALRDAVTITGSSRVTVTNAFLGASGSGGVEIDAASHAVAIDRSVIADTGEAGVTLGGGDNASLTPGGNILRDSIVTRVGLLGPTARPGVRLSGVGQIVSGCLITATPRAAIAYKGNDHRIAGNEFAETNRESGDYGALYTYADLTGRGTVIEQNYIHDVRTVPGLKRNVAVYLDGYTSGITVRRNLFADIGRAVWINSGSDNVVAQNVFVRPTDNPIQIDDRSATWNRGAGLNAQQSLAKVTPAIAQRYGAALDRPMRANGAPTDNMIGTNLVIDGQPSSFVPATASYQQIGRQLAATGWGRAAGTPIAVGRFATAQGADFGIDYAAMDRRRALAGLRYAVTAQVMAARATPPVVALAYHGATQAVRRISGIDPGALRIDTGMMLWLGAALATRRPAGSLVPIGIVTGAAGADTLLEHAYRGAWQIGMAGDALAICGWPTVLTACARFRDIRVRA